MSQDFLGRRSPCPKDRLKSRLLGQSSDEGENYFIELIYNHGEQEYELGNQFGHLAFLVPDLEVVVGEVESRGWWFRRSKAGNASKYIFVKDPDGYDIEILEERG